MTSRAKKPKVNQKAKMSEAFKKLKDKKLKQGFDKSWDPLSTKGRKKK